MFDTMQSQTVTILAQNYEEEERRYYGFPCVFVCIAEQESLFLTTVIGFVLDEFKNKNEIS